MGGQGFAPKDKTVRRNRVKPQRGEWVDLPEGGGKAPKPPSTWPARTKACWVAWWSDPAATQWTDADRNSVLELAHLHADLVHGRLSLAPEIRQRMDLLGLTQKGKRDLRWRVGGEPVAEPAPVAVMADYRAMVAGE